MCRKKLYNLRPHPIVQGFYAWGYLCVIHQDGSNSHCRCIESMDLSRRV